MNKKIIVSMFNSILFIGLVMSGTILFLGYFDVFGIGFLSAHAAFIGWILSVLVVLLFTISVFMYIAGKFNTFWTSLYPINFGLVLLGFSFIQYASNLSGLLILVSCVVALIITGFINHFNLLQRKWLVLILIVPLFIPKYSFWLCLIISVIFLSYTTITMLKFRKPS